MPYPIAATMARGSKGQNAAWWMAAGVTPWAAYAPKGAASFAASLLDLTGNGNHAVDPGGAATPGWDAVGGWDFTLGSDYLVTTFLYQTNQSQSVFMQFTDAAYAWGRYAWGASGSGGVGSNSFGNQQAGTPANQFWNGGAVTINGLVAAGNTGIAGATAYINGIAQVGSAGGFGTATPEPVFIGCRNEGGPGSYGVLKIKSFIIYDVALTAPQAALISAAMAAL